MPDDSWSSRLVDVIAQEVRRYRQARKMSAQQLADRTAELGLPIKRSVLANLESGRRDAVSVAELFVLAVALRVPPLLLTFPAGRVDTVEVIPGVELTPWDALYWASGDTPQAAPDILKDESGVIALISTHHQMLGDLYSELRRLRLQFELDRDSGKPELWFADGRPDPEEATAADGRPDPEEATAVLRRFIERQGRQLLTHRELMMKSDLVPPVLVEPVRGLVERGEQPTRADLERLFALRAFRGRE